jgi:hypothetical protein
MTDLPSPQDDLPAPEETKIPVHQEKSTLFRVVHADGVWWSVNPWSDLHLAFYSERAPIAQKLYYAPNEEGRWVELEKEREGKKGWFRELEVDIVLTPRSAYAVLDAINRYLEYMKKPLVPTPEQPK